MEQSKPQAGFVVLGLPRCRTAWLARFLSYGDWYCGHDQLRYMRTLDDVRGWLAQPNTGTCETMAGPFWRLLGRYAPKAKVVIVRRPVEEIMESLWNLGLRVDQQALRVRLFGLDRKLEQAAGRLPGALAVSFADLAREDVCAQVFEHCLPYPHNSEWWRTVSGVNLQINFPATIRYMQAHSQPIAKLRAQAKQAILRDLAQRPSECAGVTIAEEPIDTVLVDCASLFEQHCVDVGELPGNWKNKNIPLMKRMNDAGLMQILIARLGRKPVGYLMSFIGPSFEHQDKTMAQHAMFYGDPEVPGLGLKLQRAALGALRTRGVGELFARAGVRGTGDRQSTLYKRLGAEPFGQIFRIGLEK